MSDEIHAFNTLVGQHQRINDPNVYGQFHFQSDLTINVSTSSTVLSRCGW